MKNLIENVENWACKAREFCNKDVKVILLEQLKEEIASAREELKRRCSERNPPVHIIPLDNYYGCDICRDLDEVLGEK